MVTCKLSLFTTHHLSVHESQNSILLTLPTGGVATSPFQVILSFMPAIQQSDMLILSLSLRDGRGCGGILQVICTRALALTYYSVRGGESADFFVGADSSEFTMVAQKL